MIAKSQESQKSMIRMKKTLIIKMIRVQNRDHHSNTQIKNLSIKRDREIQMITITMRMILIYYA